jgi:hypothetical protein
MLLLWQFHEGVSEESGLPCAADLDDDEYDKVSCLAATHSDRHADRFDKRQIGFYSYADTNRNTNSRIPFLSSPQICVALIKRTAWKHSESCWICLRILNKTKRWSIQIRNGFSKFR